MTAMTEHCPNCDGEAIAAREMRTVPLGQRRVLIEDEFMRCGSCGEEFFSKAQADRSHRLAVERARLDDNLLTPSQIKDVRESLGLTQAQFEAILGVGEKTCVRWETGRVCQNIATDRLIRLIAADPENVRRLAAINGVAIPEAVTLRHGVAYATLRVSVPDFPAVTQFFYPLSGTHEVGLTVTDEHAIHDVARSRVAERPIDENARLFGEVMGGRLKHSKGRSRGR